MKPLRVRPLDPNPHIPSAQPTQITGLNPFSSHSPTQNNSLVDETYPPGTSAAEKYPNPNTPTRGKRSKWIVSRDDGPSCRSISLTRKKVVGFLVALCGLITIGVAVGVVVSKHKKSSSSSTRASTPASTPAVNQTNPNDPSTFEKNPNLHQSFYGLAYTPQGSQLPDCGNSLGERLTYDLSSPCSS